MPEYPRHVWQRVTLGMSGDAVWHLTGPSELYVKVGPTARDEAARIAWLADRGLPVAHVVEVGDGYLVTTALPGRPASDPWPQELRGPVIDAMADIARRLHALDRADCPFDRTLAVTALAFDLRRPSSEDLVVCHGDLCLPNVLIDPDTCTVAGLVDLARAGVADRYVDLAIAIRSIALHPANMQFGPAMADRFLEAYGETDPDETKIAFYRALDDVE